VKKNIIQPILAVLLVLAFIAAMGLLAFRGVPTDNKEFFNFTLGVLAGLVGAAVSFYFGSSKGSEDKNAMLAAKGTGGEPPAPAG
jgi:hypothetical protein